MNNNKFFTFIAPALAYIDNGKFFRQPMRVLYAIIAILNLISPILVFVALIDRMHYASGGEIVAMIIGWLFYCILAWFVFQLWWARKERVYHSAVAGDEFVAIPVFSNFIQTLGESGGLLVGVGGFLLGIFALMFGHTLGLGDAMNFGPYGIIIAPIVGFLIVVFARVMAETFRALAAIANNTKNNKTNN